MKSKHILGMHFFVIGGEWGTDYSGIQEVIIANTFMRPDAYMKREFFLWHFNFTILLCKANNSMCLKTLSTAYRLLNSLQRGARVKYFPYTPQED